MIVSKEQLILIFVQEEVKNQPSVFMNRIDFSLQSIKDNFSFQLPENEIHIWVTHLNACSGNYLKIDGKKKDSSFALFESKIHGSQICLRFLLSHYLETSTKHLQINKTELGKPILISHPEISFSIAHSGGLLALAFARHPVGIDLEIVRPIRGGAIAKKFFTPQEIKFLRRSLEEDFFYLWTAKEAALKADGCGITKGLRQAVTRIDENFLLGVDLYGRSITVTPWFLKTTFKKYFIGSVASFVSPSLIRWYDLRSTDSLEI